MQITNLQVLTFIGIFLVFLINFFYFGKNVFNLLLIIEAWWIVLYFMFCFISVHYGTALSALVLPFIIFLAGLEVVLGFYFMYFL